jgi:hypothetical protein
MSRGVCRLEGVRPLPDSVGGKGEARPTAPHPAVVLHEQRAPRVQSLSDLPGSVVTRCFERCRNEGMGRCARFPIAGPGPRYGSANGEGDDSEAVTVTGTSVRGGDPALWRW